MASSEQNTALTNRLYDLLMFLAQVVFPALGTLYFTIAQIWELGHGIEVVGTITAVDLFLGVLLKAAKSRYYKSGANFDGTLNVGEETEEGRQVNLSFDEDHLSAVIDEPGKHSVEFQVNKL